MVQLDRLLSLALAAPVLLGAQTAGMSQILERLDRLEQGNARLEQENRDLAEQVAQLRSDLASVRAGQGNAAAPAAAAAPETPAAAQSPALDERVGIIEKRIEEQAQTKVESSQKFPIRLTGMALFNAYLNSGYGGGGEYPSAAALTPAPEAAGATLRQTIIGLEYYGPRTFLGGTVNGALAMDFFTGGVNFNSTFRLRTGSINLDWKTTKVTVGIDKPIFNPRDPSSLAQVGVSPLTGAGNLWLWIPQAKVEHDFAFTSRTGLRATVGVVETHEAPPVNQASAAFEGARPGAEGRFEFYHQLDSDRRLEIAGGFHDSQTHAGGFSIPSRVYAGDWFFNPLKRLEWTGVFFTGENVSNLGAGAITGGYALFPASATAITARGGWTQLTVHTLSRLDFHLFTGLQYYESTALAAAAGIRTSAYGVNLFYRIAPNVLLGPEIAQFRTLYIVNGTRLANHYDLALAYLF